MSRERIGPIGQTYEYTPEGKRLAGTDQATWEELLAYSRAWPDTYHRWDNLQDHVTWWAYRGGRIGDPFERQHKQ